MPQRQNRSFPQKGYCLLIVLYQPWMQIFLHWRMCKEHGKERSNSAIYHHCSTKGHPLLKVDQFRKNLNITHEAKEAIHIQKADPELNRNVGKMVIPCVFDPILGIKPKNQHISSLLSQEFGSQDIGIKLIYMKLNQSSKG